MNFFKNSTLFCLISLVMNGTSHEPSSEGLSYEPLSHPESSYEEIVSTKRYLFGSLSLAPGAGLSFRERKGTRGKAYDVKVGATYTEGFFIGSRTITPVVTGDYNLLYYTRESEFSPYYSWGIGAAYIVPYIPLRVGIEFRHGFVDAGVKLFAFIPWPEVRFGIGKQF